MLIHNKQVKGRKKYASTSAIKDQFLDELTTAAPDVEPPWTRSEKTRTPPKDAAAGAFAEFTATSTGMVLSGSAPQASGFVVGA
eukprot:8305686-Pyramimonas_sp.AAC.1